MTITVLVENTTTRDDLVGEHGLSLYIETAKHKILFDAGDSTLFEINAQKLGVDLTKVDTFILSHGHHDHGGGLTRFMDINDHAKVFVQESAFQAHFSKRKEGFKDISVQRPEDPKNRIHYTQDIYHIDDELILFSKVKHHRYYPSSNQNLYMSKGDTLSNDDFSHEHNLIIKEGSKIVLIAGCAHKGMINMIDETMSIMARNVDYAIGGLHMFSRSTGISETKETVEKLGGDLVQYPTRLLTCHCTGESAYEMLKPIMGEKITYIRTGMILNI